MQKKLFNQPRRIKQQGFTLIELLIVVAIIGVLAAIGVPQYGNYLDRSAVGACTGELSSYRSAVIAESATSPDGSVDVNFAFQACAIGDGDGENIVAPATVATAFIEDGTVSEINTQRNRNDDVTISIDGGRIVTTSS